MAWLEKRVKFNMDLLRCPKCGNLVNNTECVCPHCQCDMENFRESQIEDILHLWRKETRYSRDKLIKMIPLFFVFTMVLGIFFAIIFDGNGYLYAKNYSKLNVEMQTYEGGIYHNSIIDDCLEVLPDDYEDVKAIREEWDMIYSKVMDYNTMFQLQHINKIDCEKNKRIFIDLYNFDKNSSRWYLGNYLNSRVTGIIYGLKWSSDSMHMELKKEGDYFVWEDNFPNNKDESKEYELYVLEDRGAFRVFYINVNDRSDSVATLQIYNPIYEGGYFYLTVKCLADDSTHILKAAYTI